MQDAKPMTRRADYSGKPATAEQEAQIFRPGPLYRARCWWRGYHCESPTIGYFRFDVGGWCADCGNVSDGINHNDD